MSRLILKCWQCGVDLVAVIEPLSRLSSCDACNAELHVCQFCVEYNPKISDRCNESLAEISRNVNQANFCDYFSPNSSAYKQEINAASISAKQKLNDLFGGIDEPQEPALEIKTSGLLNSNVAKGKLDDLFGLKENKE